MNYYTNAITYGNNILFRGIKYGKRVQEKIPYQPTLFVPSNNPSTYKTIYGENLGKVACASIKEAKDFVARYKDVDNFPIYGNQNYEYCFIGDNYPNEIHWDMKDIVVANIDIEVGSEKGFPDVATASEPITAITMRIDGKVFAFGCGDFHPEPGSMRGGYWMKCSSERQLIKEFLDVWTSNYPDIITGWWVRFFDIPYLVNRISKLFDENEIKRLSPWNYVYKRNTEIMGKMQPNYVISGIATYDYLELYRRFTLQGPTKENYKLDYICSEEIGEKKLSYVEHESLHLLYQHDFQKFMEYNIRDTELVEKLDDKLKLIELAVGLAYDAKCNFDDVFSQVRMWDCIIYNHLKVKHIVIPEKKSTMAEPFAGAYVKEPILGLHQWVVSFDLTSLYPSLMMMYNISPETLINQITKNNNLNEFLRQTINVNMLLNKQVDTYLIRQEKVTITPNAQLFDISKLGFLPEILTSMFADRQTYKRKMIEAEKELEAYKGSDTVIITEIKNKIAKYNNLQAVKKICLNSCYGSLGNEYSRFFDVRLAEAITLSGQLSIKWILNALNEYMNTLLATKDVDYVIASDTDSVYLNFGPVVNNFNKSKESNDVTVNFIDKICETYIQPFIDKKYQELADYVNAYEQKMIMKREKICDIGIAVSGKNYIWNVLDSEGVRYSEPQTKVVGLKMAKSNTPEIARKKLKYLLKLIVGNKKDELQDFVAITKEEFSQLPVEDIAIPMGMSGMSKYYSKENIYRKGSPIHMKGSLLYNHFLKEKGLNTKYPTIHDGEKVKYVYLKLPNPLKQESIAFPNMLPPEFGLHEYIDRDLMFEKGFISPLKAVLDVIGWSTERETTLEGFFS